jgi:hypothetical protein
METSKNLPLKIEESHKIKKHERWVYKSEMLALEQNWKVTSFNLSLIPTTRPLEF